LHEAVGRSHLRRTLRVAREYAVTCRGLGAEHVRFVATSASRDASNAADFIAGVRRGLRDQAELSLKDHAETLVVSRAFTHLFKQM